MASFFEAHFCKRERVWSFGDMFSVFNFTSSISVLVIERREAGDDHLDLATNISENESRNSKSGFCVWISSGVECGHLQVTETCQ